MSTRPGSESTDLVVGEAVRVNRAQPAQGTWNAFDGREGWVAAVSRQTFTGGRSSYVEVGVTWTRPTARRNPATDAWFRADEVVRR